MIPISITEFPPHATGRDPIVQAGKMNTTEYNNTEVKKILQGGIPGGKSLIFYTQPGVEGEVYGMQTAFNTLKSGGTCIFITSSTSPKVIKSRFRELGWDVDRFKNRLLFVDAYDSLIGAPSSEKYAVSNPENIHEISSTVMNLLRETPASTIIFGSLSTIMDLCGEKETIDHVKLWNKTSALYGHVLVYNFTAWPYSQEILSSIRKDLFNTVISVGEITGNMIFSQSLGILKIY